MKSVYPVAPRRRLKPTKHAKLEHVRGANIALRYVEMLQLRAQVHELEVKQKQRPAEHSQEGDVAITAARELARRTNVGKRRSPQVT
jgi:hypothetical protein